MLTELTEYQLYTLKCCRLAGLLHSDMNTFDAYLLVGRMLNDPIVCRLLRDGTTAAQEKAKAEGDEKWYEWNEYLDEVLEALSAEERAALRARLAQ